MESNLLSSLKTASVALALKKSFETDKERNILPTVALVPKIEVSLKVKLMWPNEPADSVEDFVRNKLQVEYIDATTERIATNIESVSRELMTAIASADLNVDAIQAFMNTLHEAS